MKSSKRVILRKTRSCKVDGVQVTRLIKLEVPEIAVLVLTDNINDSYHLPQGHDTGIVAAQHLILMHT